MRTLLDDVEEKDLKVLKVIAETLNRSNDLEDMLQSVLPKLLKMMDLTAGWIFLVDNKKPYYTFMASHDLPPALSWGNNQPMCKGTCFCLDEYWDGNLTKPVNIISCKRLENALLHDWGETNGLTHHATVPLSAGGEQFGLLNVAAPNKKYFSDDELILLQSVAFQIGTAVKRTRLFQSQKKRAENFALLDQVVQFIWGLTDLNEFPKKIIKKCDSLFQWPFIAFYMKEGNGYRLQAVNKRIDLHHTNDIPIDSDHDIAKAISEKKVVENKSTHRFMRSLGFPNYPSSVTVPLLSLKEGQQGALFIAGEKCNSFSSSDIAVLKALTSHISLAIESIIVNEKRQELLLYNERNRLARDLHDSVNQKLFSLSLTSNGMKEMISQDEHVLLEATKEIHETAQSALIEMKSLIWQLRPVGLEEGLITALKNDANKLELTVTDFVQGVYHLPMKIEETLWRIGQEALNNVKKHANTQKVLIQLQIKAPYLFFRISDSGRGFDAQNEIHRKRTLGLTSMRERAEIAGGSFSIYSIPGKGTTITVMIPWKVEKGEQHGD